MVKSLDRGPIMVADDERPALEHLAAVLEQSDPKATRVLSSDGQQAEVPESVLYLIQQLLAYLAHDRIVTLIPLDKDLTTHQAARLLNVSRPYLIKLLESNQIPYKLVGTHRRIQYQDLMAYKRQADAEQQRALEDLTQLSEELGLYDL
jgi:excisionase family DNA binding protein